MVWFADNGERLGTYNGHAGVLWECDVNFTSSRLLTGSADKTAKVWDVQTGKELFAFQHKSGVRSVGFAHGDKMILTATDSQYGATPAIYIYNVKLDKGKEHQNFTPVRVLEGKTGQINTALWGSLNQTIISGSADGVIRLWDVQHGKEVATARDHKDSVNALQFNKDHTMFISASTDHTSRLYDSRSLRLLKTYQSDRPLNAASASPLMNHVVIGGGQHAKDVTTTRAAAGHFEADFFHLVYQSHLCSVRGHFGPINSLAFNPDGRSYASGAEDGYIRLHHFDREYFNTKNSY